MPVSKQNMNQVMAWVMPIAIGAVLALNVWVVKSVYGIQRDVAVMRNEVDGLEQLKKDVSTALVVLGQHGDEFKVVNQEQLRLRGVYDDLHKRIASNTEDRFTGVDAVQLQEWVRDQFDALQRVQSLELQSLRRELDDVKKSRGSTP